jgi:hypothetical protein
VTSDSHDFCTAEGLVVLGATVVPEEPSWATSLGLKLELPPPR